jgi:hypothetical protein
MIAVSGLVLLLALVAIQLVPVDTRNPPVTGDVPTSPAVKAVLRRPATIATRTKHGGPGMAVSLPSRGCLPGMFAKAGPS